MPSVHGHFRAAVARAARGGAILVFGVAPPQARPRSPVRHLQPRTDHRRHLINPYTHQRAVELLPQMGLEKLDVQAFPLAKFQEAFAAQAGGTAATKVLILPQE